MESIGADQDIMEEISNKKMADYGPHLCQALLGWRPLYILETS